MRHAYTFGITTCLIAALLGIVVQLLVGGGVDSSIWAFPLNLFLTLFIIATAAVFCFRYPVSKYTLLFRQPLFGAGVMTVLVGFTIVMGTLLQHRPEQLGEVGSMPLVGALFRSMVNSWCFVGMLLLLLFVLCIVTMARKVTFTVRYIAFLLNHLGLLLLMIASLMGTADKCEYKMILAEGHTTSMVYTSKGQRVSLPFELTLTRFSTEGFPNKLTVVEFDTINGQILNQTQIDLEAYKHRYVIEDHHIDVMDNDIYADTMVVKIGEDRWLLHTDNSQGFAPLQRDKALTLSKGAVRRYIATFSATHINSEKVTTETVLVNHPWIYEGFYIYLEDYNPHRGVVVKLVKDNWLWLAYIGLWTLIAGALLMFITGPIGLVYRSAVINEDDVEPQKRKL